jgi:hypothetical protein
MLKMYMSWLAPDLGPYNFTTTDREVNNQ